MAWTDVDFETVNPGADVIAEGEYTFMVVGANWNKFDKDAFDIRLNIATAGSYQGVTVYFRYPNPAKADKNQPANSQFNWVNKAFKQFIDAIGKKKEAGEDPVSYITRIVKEAEADNEVLLFDAKMTENEYQDRNTQELKKDSKIAFRSVKAHVTA